MLCPHLVENLRKVDQEWKINGPVLGKENQDWSHERYNVVGGSGEIYLPPRLSIPEQVSWFHQPGHEYAKNTRLELYRQIPGVLLKHGVRSSLDVGCGMGHLISWMKSMSIDVVGVEPRVKSLECLKEQLPDVQVFLGNLKTTTEVFKTVSDMGFKTAVDVVINTFYLHGGYLNQTEVRHWVCMASMVSPMLFVARPTYHEYFDILFEEIDRIPLSTINMATSLFKRRESDMTSLVSEVLRNPIPVDGSRKTKTVAAPLSLPAATVVETVPKPPVIFEVQDLVNPRLETERRMSLMQHQTFNPVSVHNSGTEMTYITSDEAELVFYQGLYTSPPQK